ncbi:hypothetical protein [Methylibium sp.]|uniref:hypothetical protein n=1 Tax=Methylibium sp. TaxID=2067992 RepID=UPI003BACEB14
MDSNQVEGDSVECSGQRPEAAIEGPLVSPHGYTDAYGRNVSQILSQGTRVVRGPIPLQVRRELAAAVKAGVLGRLKKDGLKPEIFFHPSHKNGAIERQKREALYSVQCIATVIASPAHVREGIERAGGDVLEYALAEARSIKGAA